MRKEGQVSPFYGKIPPRLFELVRAKLVQAARAGRLEETKRDGVKSNPKDNQLRLPRLEIPRRKRAGDRPL